MDKQKSVIIAEPDFIIASEIKIYLESLDYKVHPILSEGQDLVEMVELLDPSLIISDINLFGQLDGIEAMYRLQHRFNIPYIFIVAFDDYSRLIESYYLNPICLIKKPIRFNELVVSITKAEQYLESIIAEHSL